MKTYRLSLITFFMFLIEPAVFAKLTVVASTSDLGALATEVAGDAATVDTIAKGTQDPHFIEAKPSFMVKLSRADLLISTGLELEVGWLPNIVQGARNPRVQPGARGYLELGPLIEPLEVAKGHLTRADGDVHPEGNPHFTLDPIRTGTAAILIANRLGELDAAHAAASLTRAQAIKDRLEKKTKLWKDRLGRTGIKEVVTYHKTLTYFLDRFDIKNPAILEPKPGIPPTAKHTLEVIALLREKKIPLILVENYFDSAVADRITKDVPGTRTRTVAVAVEGDPSIRGIDDLYESLVRSFESN